MKVTNLLVTTAVVAFVGATGVSMAQQDRLPQREHGAPAEKIAPQGAPDSRNHGPSSHAGESQNHGRTETTGQAPREQTERPQAPHDERPNHATEPKNTTGQAPSEGQGGRSSAQKRPEQEREKIDRTEDKRPTTGQGAAGARTNIDVKITPEKRTRMHEVIVHERNAPRVTHPNFSISVGTRVPHTVQFVALPATIVEIEPAWRGYEYFMVGDEIVVVDPRSLEIVAVIDA